MTGIVRGGWQLNLLGGDIPDHHCSRHTRVNILCCEALKSVLTVTGRPGSTGEIREPPPNATGSNATGKTVSYRSATEKLAVCLPAAILLLLC